MPSVLIAPNTHPHKHPGMTSIRAFIISSSMLLTVWLAASYATRLDPVAPSPTAKKTAAPAQVTAASPESRDKGMEAVVRLK